MYPLLIGSFLVSQISTENSKPEGSTNWIDLTRTKLDDYTTHEYTDNNTWFSLGTNWEFTLANAEGGIGIYKSGLENCQLKDSKAAIW